MPGSLVGPRRGADSARLLGGNPLELLPNDTSSDTTPPATSLAPSCVDLPPCVSFSLYASRVCTRSAYSLVDSGDEAMRCHSYPHQHGASDVHGAGAHPTNGSWLGRESESRHGSGSLSGRQARPEVVRSLPDSMRGCPAPLLWVVGDTTRRKRGVARVQLVLLLADRRRDGVRERGEQR